MNNYKWIIMIFLLVTSHTYGQLKKEKVILIFDKTKMNFEDNKFYIDGQTFKYFSDKKKYQVNYDEIKSTISTLKAMNLKIRKSKKYNQKKKEEFYYSDFFDIYIYQGDNETSGFLYPVERIWVIDGKIIN